jgi:hypothetical protein
MFRGEPFGIKTLTSHLQRILAVLLADFGDFCVTLEILGHIVSGESIKPDPQKLSGFAKIPTPSTGIEFECFLVCRIPEGLYPALFTHCCAIGSDLQSERPCGEDVGSCDLAVEKF